METIYPINYPKLPPFAALSALYTTFSDFLLFCLNNYYAH